MKHILSEGLASPIGYVTAGEGMEEFDGTDYTETHPAMRQPRQGEKSRDQVQENLKIGENGNGKERWSQLRAYVDDSVKGDAEMLTRLHNEMQATKRLLNKSDSTQAKKPESAVAKTISEKAPTVRVTKQEAQAILDGKNEPRTNAAIWAKIDRLMNHPKSYWSVFRAKPTDRAPHLDEVVELEMILLWANHLQMMNCND